MSKIILFKQQSDPETEPTYYEVKKEKITFAEKPSTALIVHDMTQLVNSMTLQSKFKAQKVRNRSMQNYSAMMQHEFRTPLATCIMFI